ncbi:uncharacterized protein LOC141904373 [Tubulanus polymorphus]|uniref:uncharacterized protein LOC141904373 n=1 Tax=Tubulanus polymorphus TaxID=672921 RepID=UPI003DA3D621
MAAQDKRLMQNRTTNRGLLTKTISKIQIILRSKAISELDRDRLLAAMETYKEKINILADLDQKLLLTVEEADLDKFITDADEYLTDIKENYRVLQRQIDRRFAADQHDTSLISDQSARSDRNSRRTVNLPKLSLMKFDGNILNWMEFFDSFNSAVGMDENLTDVQKFQYLRAQTTDEAAQVINGLSLTDGNYNHALELLKDRYGKPHVIIGAYMRALWELEPPSANHQSLRNFYDRLEAYIRGLRSLGKPEETYGDLLVPVVLDKLPGHIRQQMTRQRGNNDWNIVDLRTSLLKEIEALRAGDTLNNDFQDHDLTYPTAAFHTRVSTSKPKTFSRSNCAYCKSNNHNSHECRVFNGPGKRREIVIRDRLCFNCLGSHRSADCKSKLRCRNCQRKHHSSLCDPQRNHMATEPLQTNTDSTTHQVEVKITPTGGAVLLKTAFARISSESTSINATILFDEGAQRSFITQKMAQALHLVSNESEDIQISAFGGISGPARSLDVGTIKLNTSDGDLKIRTLIVPSISAPIHNHMSRKVLELPHIRNLELAHPYSDCENHEIELLIGADYYWAIVGNDIVRGPGPTAISSTIGYLPSGPTCQPTTHINLISALKVNTCAVENKREEINLQRFWDQR